MNRIVRAADALGIPLPTNVRATLAKLAALLIALTSLTLPGLANAATLSSARVTVSDPRPSQASVSYNFTASSFSGGTVKCVKVSFATTATGSTKPSGMVTASGITINASQTLLSSTTGWTRGGSDPDGTVTFTNGSSTEAPTGAGLKWNLDGFTNASTGDTAYWMHFNTFSDASCTTGVDGTTVEYILTDGSLMSLTIDNTLSFTVNGIAGSTLCGNGGNTTGETTSSGVGTTATTIPFGTVTTNAIACQRLNAATNATGGYTIYIRDQGQLANTLGQQIPDTGSTAGSYTNGSTNASPATFANNTSSLATYPGFNQGAYGYTTSDSSLGTGTANRFTNSGPKYAAYGHGTTAAANAEVGYEAVGVTSTDYYIAHQVGITALTQPGYYTTTVVYTCVPVY